MNGAQPCWVWDDVHFILMLLIPCMVLKRVGGKGISEKISSVSKAVSSINAVNIIPSMCCVNMLHTNPEREMAQKCSGPLLVLLTVKLFVSLPALLRNRPLHCTSDRSRL